MGLKPAPEPPKAWFQQLGLRGLTTLWAGILSPPDVMQQALEHECHVSRLINQLYELAVRENDYPTQVHLQWFITEQVEEEKVASNIVEQLKMIGERGDALLLLDRELAKRGSGMANGSRGLTAEPSL
jgi:ferritin